MALPALVAGAASLSSALNIGGIHGESYETVISQSIRGAAAAGDWTRISQIAAGGSTDGLPYNNSDGKGGWRAGQTINWSGSGYAAARALAAQLLAAHNAGAATVPAPVYSTSVALTGPLDILQAAGERAIAAGSAELNTRVAAGAAGAASAATAAEQRASLVPNLTPGQALLAVAGVGLLIFLLTRR